MDLFTHFIVPFAILTFLNVKNRLAGAFGGISIDFDVLLIGIGFLSSELFIFTHRGITHSFVFGFITAVIFLYIISRPSINGLISHIIKRDISVDFNIRNVLLAYFGVLTHLFLDFMTTGGIPLLFPFSLTRFSANIYYSTDFITTIIALVVLVILYIRINQKYKKMAMIVFLIILVSFGGIRVYEKMDTIQSQTIEEGFTYITAYPTTDMFTWTVMETNNGSSYRVYNYNNLEKTMSGVRDYQNLTVTNGTYASAQEAIKYANKLPDVIKFKWNHIYTVTTAEKVSNGWNITYTDIMGMNSYGQSELTVKT